MALASTIEVNTGLVSQTGIVIAVMPGSDPSVPVELWRAPDSAGAPDSANAVMVLAEVIKPGGINYVDRLPTDGVIYWYRSRTNGNAYGPGPYTDWVNLGAADRLMPDAVVALGDSDAVKNSAAWAQQVARMGPQVQNILPNPGFEDGLAFWVPTIPGTTSTIINGANAHGGNSYIQVTGPATTYTGVFAGDDVGKTRFFEVNPGDLVQWGGWAYRESGTAGLHYVIEITDKDKLNPVYIVTPDVTTAAWSFLEGQYLVAAGKKYVRVYAEIGNTGGGTTVARFDDAYLRVGLGALSDVPAPNTLYQIRFSGGITDPEMVDGMQSYIDFPATSNFMRIGQTPLAIVSSTNATPIVVTVTGHGYVTGDKVTIRGHLVNTQANGNWNITFIDANSFSLNGTTGNGVGGATGHVVKLSLTIDGFGNLVVYAIIRAVQLVVDGIATFNNTLNALAGTLVRSLQHSLVGNYGDTSVARVMLENAGVGLYGKVGSAAVAEADRLGPHTIAVTDPPRNTNALTNDGWVDPDGVNDGINTASRTTTGSLTVPAGSRLYVKVGDNAGVDGAGDFGTATGTQTSTTLGDTSKAWTTNQWATRTVRIVSGTGAGQTRTISSNTGTVLTVSVAWGTTPVAGSSKYTIDGVNVDAYDDAYTFSFRVTANAAANGGSHHTTSTTVTVNLEYSTDGGVTWTAVGGTYSNNVTVESVLEAGIWIANGDSVTTTFNPTLSISGAPTNLLIRLITKIDLTTNGGDGSAQSFCFASAYGTNYLVSWLTAATPLNRLGFKAFARDDGTNKMPHAYFEPVSVETPFASMAEGELQHVGGTLHDLILHDGTTRQRLKRMVGHLVNLTTVATVETEIGTVTLKGGTLAQNGDICRIVMGGQREGSNASASLIRVRFGGTTNVASITLPATAAVQPWKITIEIVRTGAATQVGWSLDVSGSALVTALERSTPAETLSGDIVISFRGHAGNAANTQRIDFASVTADCML